MFSKRINFFNSFYYKKTKNRCNNHFGNCDTCN